MCARACSATHLLCNAYFRFVLFGHGHPHKLYSFCNKMEGNPFVTPALNHLGEYPICTIPFRFDPDNKSRTTNECHRRYDMYPTHITSAPSTIEISANHINSLVHAESLVQTEQLQLGVKRYTYGATDQIRRRMLQTAQESSTTSSEQTEFESRCDQWGKQCRQTALHQRVPKTLLLQRVTRVASPQRVPRSWTTEGMWTE